MDVRRENEWKPCGPMWAHVGPASGLGKKVDSETVAKSGLYEIY